MAIRKINSEQFVRKSKKTNSINLPASSLDIIGKPFTPMNRCVGKSSPSSMLNLSSLKASAKIIGSSSGINEVKEIWSFPTGSSIESSPCLGTDDVLYVGSEDKKVYAIDIKTGKEKWSFQPGDWFDSSPCLGPDGILYVGSWDHKVYAIDTVTGKEKWNFQTGDKVRSSPCLGPDGVLYVGSDDKKVYALKFRTKEEAIEEARREASSSTKDNEIAGDNKIIKGNNTVQIRGVTLPVNQRYKNHSLRSEPFFLESWK